MKLCRALLQRGEMPRGEASVVTALPERSARQVLSRLVAAGVVGSDTPKGPVSLRFSTASAETLFVSGAGLSSRLAVHDAPAAVERDAAAVVEHVSQLFAAALHAGF